MVAGRIVAGPPVRNACRRHLDDLKRGPARGLRWDFAAAEWTIGYFREVLRLASGGFEGKPFELLSWEAFIVGSLFGWKRKADGYRRFRVAYIETAKGSGKTPVSAGIGNYMMTADGEPRAECYAIAVKKEQAQVLFQHAVAQYEQSPDLRECLTTSGGPGKVWNLAHLETASFFRPIATEKTGTGAGQSGPMPHYSGIDEIHEHKSNAAIEFSRAGVKSRRQPLTVMTTNAGFDRSSVCWEYHDYGCKVAAQDVENDEFFAYICALDEGDDPFVDESCWIKAQPSLDVIIKREYLRGQILEAQGMPGKQSIVLRLHFCVWVDADSPWIEGALWRAAEVGAPEEVPPRVFDELFPPADRTKRPCVLSLDLSESRDLTALSKVWLPDDEGVIYAESTFWTPKDTIAQREMNDRVPYAAWVKAGVLQGVPGPTIDYGFVALYVAEQLGAFDVQALAFDSWHIAGFRAELDRIGVPNFIHGSDEREAGLRLVRHGQGISGGLSEHTLWMERSIKALEDAVLKRRLRVRFNPVLRWNSASAKQKSDAQGNRIWHKRKSTGRIDGIVALCMGVGLATAPIELTKKQKTVRVAVVGPAAA